MTTTESGPLGALRAAGAMLANCAFNLAQCPRLTTAERRSLDESRRAWDEALATPVAGVATPAPVAVESDRHELAAELVKQAEQWPSGSKDWFTLTESAALLTAPEAAAQVTGVMVRDAFNLCPDEVSPGLGQWRWMADHINNTLRPNASTETAP